jgi:8-hydroxy-5-deazaflavin:NADPH oxidoreductase
VKKLHTRASRHAVASLLLAIILSMTLSALVSAETIAVIGTGQVGGALGPEFAGLGHTIVFGSRDPSKDEVKALVKRTGSGASATTPEEAAAGAGIVVLAVPGGAIEAVVKGLGDLSGKIIIDPTNPIRRREDGLFEMSVETSNAELIQGWAPEAFVVKAFNTLNWRTMVDPDSSGGPVSIPLVGDNAEAKAAVASLVEGLGLEAIDVGPIRHAHIVEGMLMLWLNNQYVTGKPFDYHLRRAKPK